MSNKKWLTIYLILVAALILGVLAMVMIIDPFFHYHKPLSGLYYSLDNERSQNDGMLKHFDYDGVSIGTSMTANTKISEVDGLFNTNAIKALFSGGSYYEIERSLETAYQEHELNTVVRCLDAAYFGDQPDYLRIDMGEYPEYLYDENPWNDVKYIYNRDVVWARCIPMLLEGAFGRPGGITDFDEYGNWMEGTEFGKEAVLADFEFFGPAPYSPGLSEGEKAIIRSNLQYNAADIAAAHPETTFYYYIPPYSAVWWGVKYMDGEFFKAIDAERTAIETLLPYDNIRLFSFNLHTDLTTDLDNYKDAMHYGEWVNSDILRWMKEGEGELTEENYQDYLDAETEFYVNFPYNTLFEQ